MASDLSLAWQFLSKRTIDFWLGIKLHVTPGFASYLVKSLSPIHL
jgi:hypothetical protein